MPASLLFVNANVTYYFANFSAVHLCLGVHCRQFNKRLLTVSPAAIYRVNNFFSSMVIVLMSPVPTLVNTSWGLLNGDCHKFFKNSQAFSETNKTIIEVLYLCRCFSCVCMKQFISLKCSFIFICTNSPVELKMTKLSFYSPVHKGHGINPTTVRDEVTWGTLPKG